MTSTANSTRCLRNVNRKKGISFERFGGLFLTAEGAESAEGRQVKTRMALAQAAWISKTATWGRKLTRMMNHAKARENCPNTQSRSADHRYVSQAVVRSITSLLDDGREGFLSEASSTGNGGVALIPYVAA